MDRQDYTRNWYMHQNFQDPPKRTERHEMQNFHGGSRELPYLPRERRYAPSDVGDYRGDFDRGAMAGGYRQSGYGRDTGSGYAASDTVAVQNRTNNYAERYHGHVNRAYDGQFQAYEVPEYNVMSEDYKRPTWIDSVDAYTSQRKAKGRTRKSSESSSNQSTFKCCTSKTMFRLLAIIFVFWDLIMDWIVAGKGPISFLTSGDSTDKDAPTCKLNTKLFEKLNMNMSYESDDLDSICKDSKTIWNVFAVFALISSLLTILQVINILCEIMKQCKPKMLLILLGQSEVLLILIFEEIPQMALTVTLLYICDCSAIDPHITVFGLLSTLSAVISVTARYISTFDGCAGDEGCCNRWWRCVCCKNPAYFCKVAAKDCFCSCDVPCPVCCCTLHCHSCKWTPQTWCGPCLKAFSCFCQCCKEDKDSYGVRLVNNLGLLIIWAGLGLQMMIFIIHES